MHTKSGEEGFRGKDKKKAIGNNYAVNGYIWTRVNTSIKTNHQCHQRNIYIRIKKSTDREEVQGVTEIMKKAMMAILWNMNREAISEGTNNATGSKNKARSLYCKKKTIMFVFSLVFYWYRRN